VGLLAPGESKGILMSTYVLDPVNSASQSADQALLSVENLVQSFRLDSKGGGRGSVIRAVDGVSFKLFAKETLGIVGETGCGKTSLARSLIQMPRPTSGTVLVRGKDMVSLSRADLSEARRHIQMVFQDPYSSLDPTWRIINLVAEPLAVYRVGRRSDRLHQAQELLDRVGLDPKLYSNRHPRQLSGGQCQRVAIARALALRPEIIIFDEAVSSLDVSVQARVINLLEDLRDEFDLSYLFIAHDLNLVRHVSDRVAVMYLGKICEIAQSSELYRQPRHPYTAALLASIPNTNRMSSAQGLEALGEMPSPVDPPSGCRFRTRCSRASSLCAESEPPLRELAAGHSVACHFPLEDSPALVNIQINHRRKSEPQDGADSL